LSRAGRNTVYPANFQLLMAVNPCPCGNFGSKTKLCLCSAKSIDLYWKKFSAPLLDRIDLRVFVENNCNNLEDEAERPGLETTSEIRKGIARAINRQRERNDIKNAKLTPEEISETCKLGTQALKILDNATNRYGFSPRAVSSCIKVARTIADISGDEEIEAEDIREAVDYRKLCCNIVPEL
jgi:hypothetical protein